MTPIPLGILASASRGITATITFQYLSVAGGGGGGSTGYNGGGGGGAGGFLTGSITTSDPLLITVGAGGNAGAYATRGICLIVTGKQIGRAHV